MGEKLKLPKVRLSFPVLADPEYYQGQKQRPDDQRRWSATLLVPNGSELFKAIEAAIVKVADEKWGKKATAILEGIKMDPKASCWVDGKRKTYDGYEGHWALTAHRKESDGRPLVLDSDKSPIYVSEVVDGVRVLKVAEGKAGRVYAGSYVNATIEFWAQDNSNGKAIRATLLGVQRAGDGDAFAGGAKPSEDDFDEVDEGSDADDLT